MPNTNNRVKLGRVFSTAGAMDSIGNDLIANSINRFVRGDWGDTCQSDSCMNDQALELDDGSRLLATYKTPNGELWIIRDDYGDTPLAGNPSGFATTLLLPGEY